MLISFKMALRSIGSNKLRAVLTMLGIIIGVLALVVLVSVVEGATSSVTDTVSSLGSDVMTVTISDDKGLPISLSDLYEWEDTYDEIGYVAPYQSATATIKYDSESDDSVTLYGTTPDYYSIQDLNLVGGRFIKSADVTNHSRICIINETTAEELIGYTDCVGKELSINGMKYEIVGVLEDNDSSLTSVFGSGSLVAYIPFTSLARLSDSVTTEVTTFCAAAGTDKTMDELEAKIEELLLERFEEDDDAYSINSQNVMEDAMSDITSTLSLLLGGIAAISLIVGGIGIMNIMLVTVTERTREIGIRKAIGATRGNILRQFLMESVVLCMMGCAIGIFLSWALLRIIGVIVTNLNMSFTLNGTVVLIAVVFCFIIGIVFGLYPANKAAKMKPIDALHYGG